MKDKQREEAFEEALQVFEALQMVNALEEYVSDEPPEEGVPGEAAGSENQFEETENVKQ